MSDASNDTTDYNYFLTENNPTNPNSIPGLYQAILDEKKRREDALLFGSSDSPVKTLTITLEQFNQATEMIRGGLTLPDQRSPFFDFACECFHDQKHRSILDHARWVIDHWAKGLITVETE